MKSILEKLRNFIYAVNYFLKKEIRLRDCCYIRDIEVLFIKFVMLIIDLHRKYQPFFIILKDVIVHNNAIKW